MAWDHVSYLYIQRMETGALQDLGAYIMLASVNI
jgi:hypothetical protein